MCAFFLLCMSLFDANRALLEQKHQEIGVMKHQLDGYENGQKSVISQYEAQLNKVKKQMTDLKVQ